MPVAIHIVIAVLDYVSGEVTEVEVMVEAGNMAFTVGAAGEDMASLAISVENFPRLKSFVEKVRGKLTKRTFLLFEIRVAGRKSATCVANSVKRYERLVKLLNDVEFDAAVSEASSRRKPRFMCA